MNIVKKFFIIFFSLWAIVTVNLFSAPKEVLLDDAFYSTLQNSDPLTRLKILETLKDTIVKGRGTVVKVETSDILKKRYRIVLTINLPKIGIFYYCYTDTEDYKDLLQSGDTFEFSGQYVVATPLSTKVDSIIMDIILEDGAVVIK